MFTKIVRMFLWAVLSLTYLFTNAQQISEIHLKDTVYVSIIQDYISESKRANFITDSIGIVLVQINTLDNGMSIDLQAIKEERASYFKQINVPSHYTYVGNVLVLFYDGLTPFISYPASYLEEVDKITDGHFRKMEEDRGAFVSYFVGPDGIKQKRRYVTSGNPNNGKTIRIYADGTRQTIRKI